MTRKNIHCPMFRLSKQTVTKRIEASKYRIQTTKNKMLGRDAEEIKTMIHVTS